ncbi:MAG: hypothetical protein GY870_03220 [archaeon]|nr:hypothetical protein [archaeon]
MGKTISIIAGLITVIGTFMFSLYGADPNLSYGIGGLLSLSDNFSNPGAIGTAFGMDSLVGYVFIVFYIWFLASGILQIAGMKGRSSAIMGSIPPLVIGAFIILYSLDPTIFPSFIDALNLFRGSTVLDGAVPIVYGFTGRTEHIGTYMILVGGFFSLISGLTNREED